MEMTHVAIDMLMHHPAESHQKEQDETSRFLKSWAWKREHRPDKARFLKPYMHKVNVAGMDVTLTIEQRPFKAEGFASTVWDSSIVVAKYIEKWQHKMAGKRLLDLSAGCGLPGIVAALMQARVVATDLEGNVDFLRSNFQRNNLHDVKVRIHIWGQPMELDGQLDYIIGCDLMYIEAAVKDLVRGH